MPVLDSKTYPYQGGHERILEHSVVEKIYWRHLITTYHNSYFIFLLHKNPGESIINKKRSVEEPSLC